MADLLLPYALDAEGRAVSAAEVPRGLACGCSCPECHQPLIAAQGEQRQWHFRHQPGADTTRCAIHAPETITHIIAKQILLAAGTVTLPPLIACYGELRRQIRPPRQITFAGAQEVWLGDIRRRPDLFVTTSTQQQLAIEVWVAHRCDDEKRADFAARGLHAIEIDLTKFRTKPPNPVVLHSAPRQWLFHPDQATINTDLARQEAEIEAKRQQAIRQNRERIAVREAAAEQQWQRSLAAAEQQRTLDRADEAMRRGATLRQHAADALARRDADGTSQRCAVCAKPYSPFGFGLPPDKILWACLAHRTELNQSWMKS